MAAETLSEVFLDHETAQMKDWVRRSSRETEHWQRATGISGRTLHVTDSELTDLRDGIAALMEPFAGRNDDPSTRPDGARAVRMLISAWLPRTP